MTGNALKRMRHRYVWILPLAWSVCSAAAHAYPGGEYSLWAIGSGAGVWILFLLPSLGAPINYVLPILLAGGLVIAAFGLLLDRLRTNRFLFAALWVAAAAALCAYSISSYPSYAKAISKNGSLMAYMLFSCNLGLYAAILLSIYIRLVVWLWRLPPGAEREELEHVDGLRGSAEKQEGDA